MGSDVSHFNVSLIVSGKVARLPTDHNFWRERRAEADSNRGPSTYQPNALPLDQTGSHNMQSFLYISKATKMRIIQLPQDFVQLVMGTIIPLQLPELETTFCSFSFRMILSSLLWEQSAARARNDILFRQRAFRSVQTRLPVWRGVWSSTCAKMTAIFICWRLPPLRPRFRSNKRTAPARTPCLLYTSPSPRDAWRRRGIYEVRN